MYCLSESSDVSYQLILDVVNNNQDMCDGVENLDEAIEFSMLNETDGQWIPLRLTYHDSDIDDIIQETNETVRGYETTVRIAQSPNTTEQVSICGDMLNTSEVRFRWVGNADRERRKTDRADIWALASVTAILITQDENVSLIQDSFGGNILK